MARKSPRHRPGLSHGRIVAAAAELVDREGVEALSARRLATLLGCEAMSLYHHVPSMKALLDEVVDQALSTLPMPAVDAKGPQRHLADMLQAYLALAESRPHTFRVVSTRRWRTAGEAAFQSRMIELLVAAGLKSREALRAARVLVVYVNGAGLAVTGWKLDTARPPTRLASPPVKKLMRLSTATSVAEDVAWGLERLLKDLLAP